MHTMKQPLLVTLTMLLPSLLAQANDPADDAVLDRTAIILDGNSPGRLACDPDGFVSDDTSDLHFAFDDNRHRAVYVGGMLPELSALSSIEAGSTKAIKPAAIPRWP